MDLYNDYEFSDQAGNRQPDLIFSQFLKINRLPQDEEIFWPVGSALPQVGYLIVLLTLVQITLAALLLIIIPLFFIGFKGGQSMPCFISVELVLGLCLARNHPHTTIHALFWPPDLCRRRCFEWDADFSGSGAFRIVHFNQGQAAFYRLYSRHCFGFVVVSNPCLARRPC